MKLRCLFGHDIPKNGIFEYYGAVFRGGRCKRCNRLVQRKFLYNAWGKEENTGHCIVLTGTNPQLIEDIESGKRVWA